MSNETEHEEMAQYNGTPRARSIALLVKATRAVDKFEQQRGISDPGELQLVVQARCQIAAGYQALPLS